MNKIHEECGVFGVYAKEKTTVASTTYYGLFALQHRGQESCGIVVNDDGVFQYHKDGGLVNDIFTPEIMAKLGEGNMAVGHVRYGTTGASDRLNAQPIVVNHIKGKMALAHNGNLVNSYELRQELEMEGSIFHTTSDTEVISYIITKERLKAPSIEEAVNQAMNRIKGAYSLVVMSSSKMIAARDPHGFHPLCYGVTKEGTYIVASETCALDAVSAKFIRDVEPGEIIVFDGDEIRTIRDHIGEEKKHLCIFEHIYFSRPDSIVDGVSVHHARATAGACLAMEHPVHADVVIGVPDSGLDAAIGYARQSGIPYGIGFIKNKYIGRTFIAPGQKVREDKVRIKLNVVSETIKGKRVVMVDDSIVRGTTSARIVKLLREAGAAEVHVRSSAPPFLFPCYYGTDVDSQENLIAVNHTMDEIKEIISADSIGYLSLDHLGMLMGVPKGEGYCSACFDGNYPTEVPSETCKNRFECKLSERRNKK
ncbi:amidophosphoribosyltransferase [Anaerotignum lactatifermentans]|uniref:Amidophosphoribosyltransferase n=1 Tax=Anaerotignum lactatifermentans TaxID=160404 RepID=A0ABS2G9R3_9FIRM|nr:amidophosphoribosyltransferase [Anaerotignum lactatifermentans]MBM6829242.1 amidophosphoribosyltransferase [Anaerotignum lactatifermentans]MBM6877518.1 amidophosphoribosyltransferase [Anaerotignum lactatifermentans]MBM6950820.1 amidophosphoribosyltransferase [Anaerotignum lactatifermentans]